MGLGTYQNWESWYYRPSECASVNSGDDGSYYYYYYWSKKGKAANSKPKGKKAAHPKPKKE